MHGREYIQAVLDGALAKLEAEGAPKETVDVFEAELDGEYVIVGYSGTVRPGHHPDALGKLEFYARLAAVSRAYLGALGTASEAVFAVAWAPLEREFAERDKRASDAARGRANPDKDEARKLFQWLKAGNGKAPTWKQLNRELEAEGIQAKPGTVRDWLKEFRQG